MKEDLDPNKKTILVVDDEKPIIDILVYNLKKEGYNVKLKDYFKIGIPFTLAAVITGYLYIWFVWGK